MAARFLDETRAQPAIGDSLRRWMRGWRLAALAAVGSGTVAGIAVASIWMTSGLVIILFVAAGPCVVVCLFWSLFSDRGRNRSKSEPTGDSDWEMRIRPRFPHDEGSETDINRQSEGGEP